MKSEGRIPVISSLIVIEGYVIGTGIQAYWIILIDSHDKRSADIYRLDPT